MKRQRQGFPPPAIRDEFEAHWQEGAGPVAPTKAAEARIFLEPLTAQGGLEGLRILDAGCGDGVHAAALGAGAGGRRVGLDLSLGALRAAGGRAGEGWAFVQGDLLSLPLADRAFDAVYSYGALAYTGAPRRALGELVRVLRPGGLLGLWICPRHRGPAGWLLAAVRGLCRRVGPLGRRVLADAIVPFLSFLPRRSGVHLGNAAWRQCREVVLVNIAPSKLAFPEPEEIREWVLSAGLEIVRQDPSRPVTLWGVRRPAP